MWLLRRGLLSEERDLTRLTFLVSAKILSIPTGPQTIHYEHNIYRLIDAKRDSMDKKDKATSDKVRFGQVAKVMLSLSVPVHTSNQ